MDNLGGSGNTVKLLYPSVHSIRPHCSPFRHDGRAGGRRRVSLQFRQREWRSMALACGKWAGLLCDPASQVVFKDIVIDPEEALGDEVVV